MAPHAEAPKVAIGPTQWSKGLYGTYEGCLAKPEVSQLSVATPSAHVLQSTPELAAAIQCMTETGDVQKCSNKGHDLSLQGMCHSDCGCCRTCSHDGWCSSPWCS